jgi:hypothetical protein
MAVVSCFVVLDASSDKDISRRRSTCSNSALELIMSLSLLVTLPLLVNVLATKSTPTVMNAPRNFAPHRARPRPDLRCSNHLRTSSLVLQETVLARLASTRPLRVFGRRSRCSGSIGARLRAAMRVWAVTE